jgi:hypothetical protein
MSVSLTPELEQVVNEKVSSGLYQQRHEQDCFKLGCTVEDLGYRVTRFVWGLD